MVVGVICFDLLLGDIRSLKQKRGVVRPLVSELRRRFSVAAAETGSQDLYRRCELSASVVAGEHRQVRAVLEECERWVAGRPEVELLSARTRVLDDDDLS